MEGNDEYEADNMETPGDPEQTEVNKSIAQHNYSNMFNLEEESSYAANLRKSRDNFGIKSGSNSRIRQSIAGKFRTNK